MTITPRSLDEARRLAPHLGFALYAFEPDRVTLEILDDGQAYTFAALDERAAWELAFPPVEVEPMPAGSFMPAEDTPARAELAASIGGEPSGDLFD